MSKLQLILLGRFECLLPSGERISLSMRKAEVLLAYLALAPGLRHPRERLINLLWSDRSEGQARNSLRQCLSSIRKSLGDTADLVLQVDRTTVSLQPGLIEVDVLEFERLAAEGDYESLATAADFYQGEFLEGISIRDASCQDWLDNERSRFKRQLVEILLNLAETQLVSHDFDHAIKSAERLVKQDPLGETGWRLLMRSYAESGDRSHALQTFKRCQRTLRDELDVEPENATLELRDRIAGGDNRPGSHPSPGKKQPTACSTGSSDHSIAVLPFDNLSGDPEQEYFSDGITDSIILHLSLFPGLNVKSRNSSFAFKQQIKSLGEISRELNVDYIVEGAVRKSDQHIRITVQLIDAAEGNQIWGKRYDADLTDLFALEEELSRAIAATVTGQIESDQQRIAIAKGAADQQSYDLLLSGIYHNQRYNRQDTVIAIEKLNQCLAKDPDNVRALVWIYVCHLMDYLERWTQDYLVSFELAAEHIHKAMALAPESGIVQVFYAQYLVFCGEFEKAEKHLDKALEINPNDPTTLTTMALNLEIQGKAEDALRFAERACLLDPYHPWAEWEVAVSRFISGQYESTLETITKMRTSPGFIQIFGIASSVKLGRIDLARKALRSFLQENRKSMLAMPQTIDEWLQYTRENYPFADPQINQDVIDCLVQAGLEETLSAADKSNDAESLPSIAVLPFENISGDPEQEHFSDGITIDIIATLSKFSHLRVVARHSTLRYKSQPASIAEIAEQQRVRYILEGSVRRSDKHIRVSAELIDSRDGKICWSERYDRDLDDLFALQDEITKNITLAMKVQLDDGDMALHRSKGTSNIKAWELTLTSIDLADTYIRQNILDARAMAKEAVELDPDYAYAWISLGWTFLQEAYSGWGKSMDELIMQAEEASRQAFKLDADYSEAWSQLGFIHVMKHEPDKAIEAFRRAVELEPGSAEIQALTAFAYIFNNDLEQSKKYYQNMLPLCPIRANWSYFIGGQIELFSGNLERAIELYQQGIQVEPDSPLGRFYLIDAMLENSDEAAARILADEIRSLDAETTGKGLVHVFSYDREKRNRFEAHLAKFDLV
ncbi:MAG: tetratricopeptide repeat protein [Gammaproteobacteria bacterium]|nr:tetratricopeptide repeat protein [Gammaproteobacteria bacterium]